LKTDESISIAISSRQISKVRLLSLTSGSGGSIARIDDTTNRALAFENLLKTDCHSCIDIHWSERWYLVVGETRFLDFHRMISNKISKDSISQYQ
jgi:hypothetical protein